MEADRIGRLVCRRLCTIHTEIYEPNIAVESFGEWPVNICASGEIADGVYFQGANVAASNLILLE